MPDIHISTKDLRPGMYIVTTAAKWHNRPYLYTKAGLIKSEEEIKSIIEQGYVETYYDPDKSTDHPIQNQKKHPNLIEKSSYFPPEPTSSIQDEIEPAQNIYNDCLQFISHMLDEVRHGKIDFNSSKDVVYSLISSLNRNQDALTSLTKIKNYDEYTFTHCINVAIFSVAFGRFLGLQDERLTQLGLAALLHDVGKMRIPKNILNAPRPLTKEEFAIIQTHSKLGADLLKKFPTAGTEIVEGVLDHHERYNGKGYPNHKSAAEISPFGRIISVSDVYDALSADRVYRTAMTPNKSLSTMFSMREEMWEPGLLDQFIKMLGIYPVGSCVSLTMGYKGIVSRSNPQAPLYPTVLLCKDPQDQDINPPKPIDLAKQHDLQIVKALSPDSLKVTLTDLLLR